MTGVRVAVSAKSQSCSFACEFVELAHGYCGVPDLRQGSRRQWHQLRINVFKYFDELIVIDDFLIVECLVSSLMERINRA